MKKKKLLGKIVSLVLAAALTVTALPTTGIEVQAAEQVQTETEELETTEDVATAEDESSQAESEEKSEEAQSTEEEKSSEAESEEEKKTSSEDESEEESSSETESEEEEKDPEVADNAEGEDVKSPVVETDKVTFNYYDATATSVSLCGVMTDNWGSKLGMTKSDDTNVWSVSIDNTFKPGKYEYKIVVGEDGWNADPKNPNTASNGNSELWIPGLVDGSVTIKKGETAELPKLKLYSVGDDGKGTEAEQIVTYTLSEEDQQYTDYVTLSSASAEESQTITIEKELAPTVTQLTLDASVTVDGKAYTATLTVTPQGYVVEKSPVVKDGEATFYYFAPAAEKVILKGSAWGWDANKIPMTLNTETYWWEATAPVSPGKYEYGFEPDNGWDVDHVNPYHVGDENSNSVFWVAGLEEYKVEVARGGDPVELKDTLNLYTVDENGRGAEPSNKTVTYKLSDEADSYADKIELTAATDTKKATISLKEDFPKDVESFALIATEESGKTSTITINVVDKQYKYTIYYYDADHNTPNEAALHIWENVDGATGIEYLIDGKETLSDGKEWLKAELTLSYTDFGFLVKSPGEGVWTWQTSDLAYVNEDKDEETTLYVVDDEVYTDLTEASTAEKRWLLVEYNRNDGSAKNWYFYTWTGKTGFYPFEKQGDKWIATVPVKKGLSSMSYCIERADVVDGKTEHWAEKDGGDYLCPVPEDQTVVKIVMEEGKGIVKTYPYNVGYELAPKDKKIHFYYRNNDAFLEEKTDKYASVAIEINGTEYPMTFDVENQRYTYDFENLRPGEFKYRYVLKENADSDAVVYEIDRYNEITVTEGEAEYSVVKYDTFKPVVSATTYRDSMDYNDNNVLTVKVEAEEGADIKDMEIAEAYADLTALGGSDKVAIVPELLELTIAVKQGVEAGEKRIPVTVYDQFKNEYTAEATVTVTDRNKGTDFDWDEAVIYFAVTDRFFDGNTSNNGAGYDKSENGSSSYHGGDFAGLTQKLDYLKELGVNTIWITPIVANDMEDGLQTDVDGIKSWGYHGYWASDFEKLDSHLGTEEEFSTLLNEAHNRGMKIMVDVVLNHSGYNQEAKFNNILKDENGNPVQMIRDSKQMVTGSDQKTSLSRLPDFLTENAEVRDLLVEWQSNWISKYDIDYYRVDTVKHVDDATWSAFKNALTKINPKFKMIGEWAGAGYATDTGMLRTGRMDSLLDFDFNGVATDFVTGGISNTESFLCNRNAAIDNTATVGHFIGSHDEDGFAYNLVNEKGITEAKAADLTKVAAALQITAKGQPVIYYGEEIGLTGANNYPYQTNRYDFDWSKVTDDNDTLTHYKKLLAIRNRYSEVLAKGTRTTITADNTNGLDVFARSYGDTTLTIALNISDSKKSYTVENLEKGYTYTDCYSGNRYVAGEDGKISITIPAAADGGTAVLVKGEEFEEKFYVSAIADQTYTGSAIKLSASQLKVYYGLTELKAGTDYTVKYVGDTKNVGTVTVKITGKGNYAGTPEEVTFNIVPKSVADQDVVIDYNDILFQSTKVQKPLTKITYNGKKLGTKDYKVEYFKLAADGNPEGEALAGVKEAGSYRMVVTGLGNYTGTKSLDVNIFESGTYISKASIKLEKSSYDCDGSAHTPAVTVKYKGATLTLNEDYTVAYTDNVNVGTAKVIITGIPAKGYYGSVTKTFKINGQKLSSVAKVDETGWQAKVDYNVQTRNAVQPDTVGLVLKSDGTTKLALGTDYTVSYQKNDKPGTASMVFTGTGKYTGTIKKNFTVNKITLSADDTNLQYTVSEEAPYTKKGAQATVSVRYNNVVLKEGQDYKLTYSNNKKVDATATVTINGMGAFTGKVSNDKTTFKVVKANLADVKITANDVVYSNKAGKFMSTPVLTDSTGSKLSNNKDYTLKYYQVNADGTEVEKTKTDVVELVEITTEDGTKVVSPAIIKVVATAAGNNYVADSTASYTYRVVQSNISSAKVTAKAKVYTGKAITLDKYDLTVKIGDSELELGKDYEIVTDSYVNNIKKGTASVTIKGIGNYTGTKKVTFKITSRTMAWWWNIGK